MEGSGGGEIEAKEMLASFASRGQPRGWIHYSFKALRVGMVNSPALASRDRSTASGLPSIPSTVSIDSRMDANCQLPTTR